MSQPAAKPELISHGGDFAGVRENTLAVVAAVIASGATGLEVDVHLTADGVVVIHHDHVLAAETTRHAATHAPCAERRPLEQLTWRELSAYEAAERIDAAGGPTAWAPLPRLENALGLWRAAPAGRRFFVELKNSPEYDETRTDPGPLAEAVVALIERYGLENQTALLAFDWRALARAKALNPAIARYHLSFPMKAHRRVSPRVAAMLTRVREDKSLWCGDFDPDRLGCTLAEAVARAGGDGWAPYHTDLDAAEIAAAHALGLKVAAWTIDDRSDVGRLIPFGLDTLITDGAVVTLARAAAG
jgi:glycerophosphoryl diester phosphodiesterase